MLFRSTVDAAWRAHFAGNYDVGRHIAVNFCAHTGKRVCANAAKLVHQGETAQNDVVLDSDMAGEGGTIGKYRVAADDAIVRDVHISHDPVVVTDDCFTTARYCAAIKGYVFPNYIAIADDEFGVLVGKFFVLRRRTYRSKLPNAIIAAHRGWAFNNDVRADHAICADFYFRANDAVWADLHTGVELGAGVNDCAWVD